MVFTKPHPDRAALAETEGFEPSVRFPVRRFSKALVSATHPRLQAWRKRGYSDAGVGDQHGIACRLTFRRFTLSRHGLEPAHRSLPGHAGLG